MSIITVPTGRADYAFKSDYRSLTPPPPVKLYCGNLTCHLLKATILQGNFKLTYIIVSCSLEVSVFLKIPNMQKQFASHF